MKRYIILSVFLCGLVTNIAAQDEYPSSGRAVNERNQKTKGVKAEELRVALLGNNLSAAHAITKELSLCEIKELLLLEDAETKECALDTLVRLHLPPTRRNEALWGGVSLDVRLVLDPNLWKN